MPMTLHVGARVRLRGLDGRPELNGRLAKVLRQVKESGRWKISLEGEDANAVGATSMALKEECLEVLPHYVEALARTLLLARERAGLATGKGSVRLRTVHVLGATAWELGLLYGPLGEASAHRVGDQVVLAGLESRPELNGTCGIVERFIPEKGRWKVILGSQYEPEGATCGGSESSGFVFKPENLVPQQPHYRHEGVQGPWLQNGARHVIVGSKCIGPDGDKVEDIVVLGAEQFTLSVEGETRTATMTSDGETLTWSDGGVWARPSPKDEALVRVVLVGPELPADFPEGRLHDLPGKWPEPGVYVSVFRGTYERFCESPDFTHAEAVVLAHPGLAPAGVGPGFFAWAPALYELVASGRGEKNRRRPELCCACGCEPFAEGEWLGDAVYDERVIRALGFDIVAPTTRSPHASFAKEHPISGWQQWAFSLVFRWPEEEVVGDLEDWMWTGYYNARRSRNELPRFRFRPSDPAMKPQALIALERRHAEQDNSDADANSTNEAEEEAICAASMGWVAATVGNAWLRGGGAGKVAAAAAAAVAAAEEFADRTRSRQLPPGQEHVVAAGACELAARIAASADAEGAIARTSFPQRAIAAVAAVAAVAVFEALAQQGLWPRHDAFQPELVGKVALGGLMSVEEKVGLRLPAGVAEVVGQKAADAFELLSGPNRPPLERLRQEFEKLARAAGECVDRESCDIESVACAVADNLDLAIPALGGREAGLRISMRMHDAPPSRKDCVQEPGR